MFTLSRNGVSSNLLASLHDPNKPNLSVDAIVDLNRKGVDAATVKRIRAGKVEKGDVLISSIRLVPATLHFENKAGVPTAAILLTGVVLNDEGKVLDSFDKRLNAARGTKRGRLSCWGFRGTN
mgnify:CR=1 FL=1